MSQSEKPREYSGTGRNINDWARALRSVDKEFADRLNIPREEGYQATQELGLPVPESVGSSLVDFLSSPEALCGQFDTDRLVFQLLPKDVSLPRFTRPNVKLDEVLATIHERIPEERREEYNVLLHPYYDVKYGGNIVVNPSGSVVVEFRDGDPGPVAYGTEVPPYAVHRDEFLGSFKYDFEDPALREEILDVLNRIPHEKDGRDAVYHPGYYEFILVEKEKTGPLAPFFIDYRSDPSYFTDGVQKPR